MIRKHRRIFLERRRWLKRDPDLPWYDVDVQMEDYLTAGRLVELLDGDPVSGERFHSGARNGLRRFDKFRKLVRSDMGKTAMDDLRQHIEMVRRRLSTKAVA